jgi:holin-like protein
MPHPNPDLRDAEPDAAPGSPVSAPASDSALRGLAWLLVCQSAGELLVRALALPLPGPVIGMLLMLGLLAAKPVRAAVGRCADVLLTHLSLLFVPVGVGVMAHLSSLSAHGWKLALVLLLSTWIALAVTAWTLRALTRRSDPPAGVEEPGA